MSRLTILNKGLRSLVLVAAAVFSSGHARADIDLRVESWPNTDPIEAFVRVTDVDGPVTGLVTSDFAVTLDGTPLSSFISSLPPDQDPAQSLSIVFVIDETFESDAIHNAVTDFINQMSVGDVAAIVRFRRDPEVNRGPLPAVQPFTPIDAGAGTSLLIDFLATPITPSPVPLLFPAMMMAIDQFMTPSLLLPNGPKAIILIGNGARSICPSQSDVVAHANANGIPIFTVGIGNIGSSPAATARMESFAEATGGTFVRAADAAAIAKAYENMASLLVDAYRVTIPRRTLTDCNPHMLEVAAEAQSTSIAFTRCDTTPDDFDFPDPMDVAVGSVVVSDTATITGIESPVEVVVIDGE
jgi:hypothetical protein